jgi:hypothetical protein
MADARPGNPSTEQRQGPPPAQPAMVTGRTSAVSKSPCLRIGAETSNGLLRHP